MRFRDLRLVRYGNFENRTLPFPLTEGTQDLHVIYGSNEAGKSTTLEAVNDFLFGFPHNKSQDYRFDANLLQVGATVEDGEAVATFYRKRGRSGTLRHEMDGVAPEGVLAAMLRGQTRESFRLSWSLDHLRLRDGGKAIVDARNDIGQAIFAAGAGLGDIPGIILELEKAADDIWGERAAGRRTYTQAERDFNDAIDRERTARVKPTDWKDAKERLEELTRVQETKESLRRTLQQRLRGVERVRRIAASARQLELVAAEAASFTSVRFLETEEAAFDQAMEAITKATLERDVAARLLNDERDRLATMTLDTEVLERSEAIAALCQRPRQVAGAARDRVKLEAELSAKHEIIAELLAEVGLGGREQREVLALLPSRPVVDKLKRDAKARDRVKTERNTLAQSRAEVELKATRFAARLQATLPIEGVAPLKAAVMAAQKAGDLDQALRRASAELKATEAKRDETLGKLAPWLGDIKALSALVPPPDCEIDAHRTKSETASQSAADLRRQASALRDQAARLRLEKDQLASTSTAVPANTLTEARADRERKWAAIRRAVLDDEKLADAPMSVNAFENRVAAADKIADARFATAEGSALLGTMEDQLARIDLESRQVDVALAEAEAASELNAVDWLEGLRSRGLPALEAAALRDWLRRRDLALDLDGEVNQASADLEDIKSAAAALSTDLAATMPAATTLMASSTFATRLAAVQTVLEDLTKRAIDRDQLETSAREAADALRTASDQLAAKEEELTAANVAWDAALAKAELIGLDDAAALDFYERLRGDLSAAALDETRIGQIIEAERAFARDVDKIAAELGLPDAQRDRFEFVQALERRLDEAKATQARFGGGERAVETREAEFRKAVAILDSEMMRLKPLMARAAVEKKEALAEAVTGSKAQRSLLEKKSSLERQILQGGDGLPLETLLNECQAAKPEQLASDVAEITAEIDKLTTEITEIANKRGEAGKTLEGMERGPDAALAAAEAALARSEMDVQAEAYLLRRAQALLLRWAVERHRREFQSPLLARAKSLFERLTLGRYVDLDVDDNRDSHRILGVCVGRERTVPVEVMSDGTVDQLYLSLRLAALEHSVGNGVALPFLADDLFINFDDDRTRAGIEVLAEVARATQVLVFTHHQRVVELARNALGDRLHFHDLSSR
jgi:uncharacterized protein YhaN